MQIYYFIPLSLHVTLAKLCHVQRDHLVNFYISLEKKCEKSRRLWNGMTDLHKIWQDDADHVLEVQGCQRFQF